jgi:NAD(P)-dependent dehydrogenase (short-subunit alcohol dehydrogenase family)
MRKKGWTAEDMPKQNGKTAIITGTGGLGLCAARELANKGARVMLAGRSAQKGGDAIRAILSETPDADARFMPLDLAGLRSIAAFCGRILSENQKIDVLINNAGLMTPEPRGETEDGFELQFGTNYLGHFALVKGLLPLLLSSGTRVVSLGSVAAKSGKIRFDDPNFQRGYNAVKGYRQSKLACHMFGRELQRRHGDRLTSVIAHPGFSSSELINREQKSFAIRMRRFAVKHLKFMSQPQEKGVLPILLAATDPAARGGEFYGPDGFLSLKGRPTRTAHPRSASNPDDWARLWELSEKMINCERNIIIP